MFFRVLGRKTLLEVERISWELIGAQRRLFWVYIGDFRALFIEELLEILG